MRFTTFIFRNLSRRRFRSLLTITAIAIAIGAYVALVGASTGFQRSFSQLYDTNGVDIVVVKTRGSARVTGTLSTDLGPKMRAIPGVRDVWSGLVEVRSFDEYNLQGVVVQGWEPGSGSFEHLKLLSGRKLQPGDGKSVMLGKILADNMQKNVGEVISLEPDEDFTVVGIYETGNIFETGAMVLPLNEMQRLMLREGQVTGFSILLDHRDDPKLIDEVKHAVEALGHSIVALPSDEHVQSLTELKLVQSMAWLTSGIALLIGIFGMMNTMMMSVQERTKEIGILRAIGWRKRRIVQMLLMESIFLSQVGAVVGVVGAMALLQAAKTIPSLSGLLSGHVSLWIIGMAFLIALGVGLFGGLLPAQRAASLIPMDALRHE